MPKKSKSMFTGISHREVKEAERKRRGEPAKPIGSRHTVRTSKSTGGGRTGSPYRKRTGKTS